MKRIIFIMALVLFSIFSVYAMNDIKLQADVKQRQSEPTARKCTAVFLCQDLEHKLNGANHVAVNKEGTVFAVATGNTINWYDQYGKELYQEHSFGAPISCMAINPEGTITVVGLRDGSCEVFEKKKDCKGKFSASR